MCGQAELGDHQASTQCKTIETDARSEWDRLCPILSIKQDHNEGSANGSLSSYTNFSEVFPSETRDRLLHLHTYRHGLERIDYDLILFHAKVMGDLIITPGLMLLSGVVVGALGPRMRPVSIEFSRAISPSRR